MHKGNKLQLFSWSLFCGIFSICGYKRAEIAYSDYFEYRYHATQKLIPTKSREWFNNVKKWSLPAGWQFFPPGSDTCSRPWPVFPYIPCIHSTPWRQVAMSHYLRCCESPMAKCDCRYPQTIRLRIPSVRLHDCYCWSYCCYCCGHHCYFSKVSLPSINAKPRIKKSFCWRIKHRKLLNHLDHWGKSEFSLYSKLQ